MINKGPQNEDESNQAGGCLASILLSILCTVIGYGAALISIENRGSWTRRGPFADKISRQKISLRNFHGNMGALLNSIQVVFAIESTIKKNS